jgi:parallel beta-helix repeat protein
MFILLLLGISSLAFNIKPAKGEWTGTVYIRADGSIDPPTAPISTVDNFTYTFTGNISEGVMVERSNIIIDVNSYKLQGSGIGLGLDLLYVNNVTIKNSYVTNFGYGIRLYGSFGCTISGNNLSDIFYYGIWFFGSSNNRVCYNSISNTEHYGIWLEESSNNNSVSSNTAVNNGYGITLGSFSSNNIISSNLVANNNYAGIQIANSHSNSISANNITADNSGIYLSHSSNNVISRNIITNNTYNGIELYENSVNNSIVGNTITNNRNGILLSFSNFEIVSKNIVLNNYFGILLSGSSNNSIMDNEILKNYVGVFLEYTDFNESAGNTIVGNTISNNEYGVGIEECSGNTIYHNNFINNTMHAGISLPHTNTWDDDYPSGGNYWSDYVGVDVKSGPGQDLQGSDGIGDTPYIINERNRDRYPLMTPYGAPPPQSYSLTITATVGGTTNPAPGTYGYTANSSVQVTAIPDVGYLFDYWELDSVNVGSANPYALLMDKNHTLKAFFSPIPPPLSASISPLSASINVGQSVTFTSTVSGGYTPYSYQWYLNGNPVSGATSSTWTFTPTTAGIYYVYLKVTDAKGNTAQPETARITVAAVPVGGYSIPIQVQTKAEPIIPYIALTAILTAAFIKVKRKIKKRTLKTHLHFTNASSFC